MRRFAANGGEELTYEEADLLIREADVNHDGQINFGEFVASNYEEVGQGL